MKIEEFRSRSVEVPIGVALIVRPYIWELKKTTIRKTLDQQAGVRRRPRYAFFARQKHAEVRSSNPIKGAVTAPERAVQLGSQRAFIDAWALRDEFLSLKSVADFLGFLNKVGRFSGGVAMNGDWELSDLKGWQQVFRELLKCSPGRWEEYLARLRTTTPGFNGRLITIDVPVSMKTHFQLHLSWQRRSGVIGVSDAVSAILASIYIDHLRGLHFRFCARPDCRRPFEITSRHKKKYCEQYCGHLESLRRMRKRRKAQKVVIDSPFSRLTTR
jgi:hypothetical protein